MACFSGTNIVNDNLVFYLDAENDRSYPGSGTTWYDLSENSYNATLYNSPIHSNGKMKFDGLDSYAEINPGLKQVIENANGFTILTVANIKFIEHVDNLVGWGNANTGADGYSRNFGQYATGASLRTSYMGPSLGSSDILNQDIMLVSRYDDHVYYSNTYGNVNNANVDDNTGSTVRTWKGISTSWPITIAKTNYYNRWMEVDVASIQMYNRFLSEAEIKQNFEATRTRYGI